MRGRWRGKEGEREGGREEEGEREGGREGRGAERERGGVDAREKRQREKFVREGDV